MEANLSLLLRKIKRWVEMIRAHVEAAKNIKSAAEQAKNRINVNIRINKNKRELIYW